MELASPMLQSCCEISSDVVLVESGPRHPDTPLSLQLVDVSHDSVTLNWFPGFDGGLPQKYRIRYQQVYIISVHHISLYSIIK